MADGESLPRVLVLGGTGFIGRHLVSYLVGNGLVSKVRVADKVPPQMAWLNPTYKDIFTHARVEFKHSSLISQASVQNAFTDTDGEYDYVINLAAETKYGQSDPVYQEGIVKLSMNCAQEAAKRGIKLFIELSSGQMHSSDKNEEDDDDGNPMKSSKESSKCEPWTRLARHKLDVESQLESLTDLNYIIVRPAIVYGVGDRYGLTPRLMIGAIYKYIKQKMKMLWTKDLKMNTVHVEDLCRALWHLCTHSKRGEIYNVVDTGDTTQGMVSQLVSDVFSIQYDFVGSMISNLARVKMSSVVEDINDKHMSPWAEACQRDRIVSTPLNPFLDEELLYNKHTNLDGSKLTSTGFTLLHPLLKAEYLKQVLDDYIAIGLFPKSLLSDDNHWNGNEADGMTDEKLYLDNLNSSDEEEKIE